MSKAMQDLAAQSPQALQQLILNRDDTRKPFFYGIYSRYGGFFPNTTPQYPVSSVQHEGQLAPLYADVMADVVSSCHKTYELPTRDSSVLMNSVRNRTFSMVFGAAVGGALSAAAVNFLFAVVQLKAPFIFRLAAGVWGIKFGWDSANRSSARFVLEPILALPSDSPVRQVALRSLQEHDPHYTSSLHQLYRDPPHFSDTPRRVVAHDL
jgi:hypothetical protein